MRKTLFLALMLGACLAHAQSSEAVRVELMVIRHADSAYEIMRRQAGDERGGGQQTLEEAALDLGGTANEQIFPITTNLMLDDEADKLNRSSDYDVLYRGGWQQPVMSPGQAQLIRFLNEPQNGLLAGHARISFDNYFLLRLSLLYDINFHLNFVEQSAPEISAVIVKFDEVIEEKRVYYFDHPAVGVVITTQTVDSSSPENAPTAEDN